MLTETTGKRRGRVWQYRGTFDALDSYAAVIRRVGALKPKALLPRVLLAADAAGRQSCPRELTASTFARSLAKFALLGGVQIPEALRGLNPHDSTQLIESHRTRPFFPDSKFDNGSLILTIQVLGEVLL